MGKVVVQCVGVSLDGYSAGPDQSIDDPLGVGGVELMEWMFPTKTFTEMQRKEGGETGVDNDFVAASMSDKGAWILGRNMFGPVRGPWPDDTWKGWWGEAPPYHVPTVVLTHYPRDPVEMKGGTTFIFVTDGIESALEQAKAAAGDLDVRIGGGSETIRQYLRAGLIDELHLAQRPVILGAGESVFEGLNIRECGYNVVRSVQGERATHVLLKKEI